MLTLVQFSSLVFPSKHIQKKQFICKTVYPDRNQLKESIYTNIIHFHFQRRTFHFHLCLAKEPKMKEGGKLISQKRVNELRDQKHKHKKSPRV